MAKARKFFGAVLLIFSGLLLLSFAVTICSGIVNHGNIIGSTFCLGVILLYIFYGKLIKIPFLRVAAPCLAVLFAVSAAYSVAISLFMFSGMMNTPQQAVQSGTFGASEPHTVIVLGCKAINGQPSRMLKARLDTAADYLREHPEAVCILSGGQGTDETEPEARTMYKYLITNGIDETKIYTEEQSTSTEENIIFSKKIIEKEDLPRSVVIISESYHVFRGVFQAEKNGLQAAAVSAPSTNVLWALPSYWVREIFAISRDFAAELF